jgi:hypothetical protein
MAKKTPARKSKNTETQPPIVATFQAVSSRAKRMSPEEFRASLVKAGIVGRDGQLCEQYQSPGRKRNA